jgi:hypothetical protein
MRIAALWRRVTSREKIKSMMTKLKQDKELKEKIIFHDVDMIFKIKSNFINDGSASTHCELSICVRSTRHPTDTTTPVNVSISRIECMNISNLPDDQVQNIIVDIGFSCSLDASISSKTNDNFIWRRLTEPIEEGNYRDLIQSNGVNVEGNETESDVEKDDSRVFTFKDEDPQYSFATMAEDLKIGKMIIGIRNASDNNNLLSSCQLNISDLLNQLK